MPLGDKLLDTSYTPSKEKVIEISSISIVKSKCPVKFTNDPIEYSESDKFLGIKLFPLQRNFLEDLFSTDSQGNPLYDEGVFIAGMRGGKSVLAAIIGTFQAHKLLAYDNPGKSLGQLPGQRITVQCISSSQAQSNETAYAAIEALLKSTYWWQRYIAWLQERELEESGKYSLFLQTKTSIEFREKNVAILSLHSNSSALAGKTSACCIFDELSRFNVAENELQAKTQSRSAQAVYNTVSRAAKSLKPFSKVVTITSPMYEDDYGMRLLYRCGTIKAGSQKHVIMQLASQVPTKVPRMIGYHATTMELNPNLTEEDFASEKIAAYEAYRRDYLAIPPSASNPFFEYPERVAQCFIQRKPTVLFENQIIEQAIFTDKLVQRRYVTKKIIEQDSPLLYSTYVIACDPGESEDSFTVCMGHYEIPNQAPKTYYDVQQDLDKSEELKVNREFKIVIDFIEEWKPDKSEKITVLFENVEEIILTLSQYYNVKDVVYDTWSSVQSIQRLFASGINTIKMNCNLQMYQNLKTLMYTGYITIPENSKLLKELKQLELIRNQKIDHPPDGSKDLADALCRAVWWLQNKVISESIAPSLPLGLGVSFPTSRTLLDPFADFSSDSEYSPYGAFDTIFSKKSTFVHTNVTPNLDLKKGF